MPFSHPSEVLNTDTTHPDSGVLREAYESVSLPSAALRNTDLKELNMRRNRDTNKDRSIEKEKKGRVADDSKNWKKVVKSHRH